MNQAAGSEAIGQMETMEATQQGRGGGFHALDRRQLIGTIVGLQLTLLLAALDQTIVGTAMPRIIAQLNGFERYAWVTTAYLLTSTIAVPIVGKASDTFGRKWFFLGGAVLFVLASALCGAAGDIPGLPGDGMTQLIVFRGIQGIGAGLILALVFTIVGDIFPPAERGKYQGLFAAVWGLASVFGPTLGGWITDNLSWRWVFYVNLPFGLLAIAVVYFAFPYFKPEGVRRAIDVAGAATLTACLVPLLLALTWVTEYGWSSPRVVGLLVVAALMLPLFLFAEVRAKEPILPLSLFRDSIVSVSSLALFLTGMAMFGSILFIPLFMQGVIGVSATQSGSLLTPMMLTMMAMSIVSGQLISRLGRYKVFAIIGPALMMVGMYLLGGMGADTSRGVVVRNMIVVGLGLGLVMPIYTLIVQNAVDPRRMGVATAATQFFRSIGGTVGAAVFGSIMLGRYQSNFDRALPPGVPDQVLPVFRNPLQLTQLLPRLQEQFARIPNGQQVLQTLLNNVRDSLVYAIDGVFLIGAGIVAVAFVANFFLREIPLRKREAPGVPAAAPARPATPAATEEAAPAAANGRVDHNRALLGLVMVLAAREAQRPDADPQLLATLSSTVDGRFPHDWSEAERGRAVAREIIEPMAIALLASSLTRPNGREHGDGAGAPERRAVVAE
jgi:EmrB/QacA subfamily drug resistance transporter